MFVNLSHSFCLSASWCLSQACACSHPHIHTHIHSQHRLGFWSWLKNHWQNPASVFTCRKHTSLTPHSTCCHTPLSEEGVTPLFLLLCFPVLETNEQRTCLCHWSIPLLFSPHHGCTSAFPWIYLSFMSWVHFIQTQFSLFLGRDWNPELWISLHILPHLLWFTWWTRWAAFLSFVRRHPEPHLSFFPLKDSDLLPRMSSQDDISQSMGAGCAYPPVVGWNRGVLRTNISVSLSKSLLFTVSKMAVIISAPKVEKWNFLTWKVVFSTSGFIFVAPLVWREHPIWVQAPVLWNLHCRTSLPVLGSKRGFGSFWGNRGEVNP